MLIQAIDRLREERDEAQVALEQGCREAFLPGMLIVYCRGNRRITVEVIGADSESDYLCRVRNPRTGAEYTIPYESIIDIA
jgi:hypothetical protein